MSKIRFHDSAMRRVVDFRPSSQQAIRIYSCGPTVHDEPHVGNARSAVLGDLWRSILEQVHGKVIFVRNITDIDDKIIQRAQREGVGHEVVSERALKQWHASMAELRVTAPTVEPRATEHLPAMFEMIERLLSSGHAYALRDGHVLFRNSLGKGLGFLKGQTRGFRGGHRRIVETAREDSSDFVLWKPAGRNEVGWSSPWGHGRPGWHIECSAMAAQHLGDVIDIHMGGADLKTPHHENEISQSCAAHGTDVFSRHWMHWGLLSYAGGKMSKSLGNVRSVPEETRGDPERGIALRLALMSGAWNSSLTWDDKRVDIALTRLRRWWEHAGTTGSDMVHPAVLEPLLNNGNTPLLFAHMDEWSRGGGEERQLLGNALGFLKLSEVPSHAQPSPEVLALKARRDAMRAAKDWNGADMLRQDIQALGWQVKDMGSESVLVQA